MRRTPHGRKMRTRAPETRPPELAVPAAEARRMFTLDASHGAAARELASFVERGVATLGQVDRDRAYRLSVRMHDLVGAGKIAATEPPPQDATPRERRQWGNRARCLADAARFDSLR